MASLWFIGILPLARGVRLARKHHTDEPVWTHPLVQVGFAWLLAAAPTICLGREISPASSFP